MPDLPCEECEEFALKCKELNLCLVPLISVTSGGRADEILKFGSGFIYVLGAIGVSLHFNARKLVEVFTQLLQHFSRFS